MTQVMELSRPVEGQKRWPMVKLGDVCTVIAGQSPPSSTYNSEAIGMPFYQGKADFGALFPKVRNWCSAPVKVAKTGDILISVRAPVGPTNIADSECCIGRGLSAIRTSEKISTMFLLRYLRYFEPTLASQGVGSTFHAISQSDIKSISLPLPPLDEQQRIVARLDLAQRLIDQRKAQIELMDGLVQALFYEMFGDPVKNEKGYQVVNLSDISKKITDGTHLTPQFIDSGIPFIFVKNIRNGKIDFKTDKYITEEQFRELTKRAPIEPGDILYTTVGATYGFAALVGQFTDFCFQRHVAHVKPNKDVVLPKFLELVMQSPTIKAQADRKVRGAAQPTLNLKELREFSLVLPPLPLQQAFADRVQQIEALKQQMQTSLAELEQNFQALMQEAFRG